MGLTILLFLKGWSTLKNEQANHNVLRINKIQNWCTMRQLWRKIIDRRCCEVATNNATSQALQYEVTVGNKATQVFTKKNNKQSRTVRWPRFLCLPQQWTICNQHTFQPRQRQREQQTSTMVQCTKKKARSTTYSRLATLRLPPPTVDWLSYVVYSENNNRENKRGRGSVGTYMALAVLSRPPAMLEMLRLGVQEVMVVDWTDNITKTNEQGNWRWLIKCTGQTMI